MWHHVCGGFVRPHSGLNISTCEMHASRDCDMAVADFDVAQLTILIRALRRRNDLPGLKGQASVRQQAVDVETQAEPSQALVALQVL